MSKRSDLSALFRGYKQKYDSLQAAIQEVRKSTLFTDEGKKQEIQRLIDEFNPTVAQYHDLAASILDESIQSLSAQWSQASMSKLTDGNYQAGLSNVLKMIEVGGITRKEDMQAIIDTYRGDNMAMSSIRNMISEKCSDKTDNLEWSNMIPKDSREHNMKVLQQLKGNIDNYINVSTLNSQTTENSFNDAVVSISMDSMSEFVDTRLADDFSLAD